FNQARLIAELIANSLAGQQRPVIIQPRFSRLCSRRIESSLENAIDGGPVRHLILLPDWLSVVVVHHAVEILLPVARLFHRNPRRQATACAEPAFQSISLDERHLARNDRLAGDANILE